MTPGRSTRRDRSTRGWSPRPPRDQRATATLPLLVLALVACAPARVGDPLVLPLPAEASVPAVDSTQVALPLDVPSTAAGALRIGPGDQLDITVLDAPELTRAVRVDGAGRVSLPLVGEIAAGGLTPREFELRLADTLGARFIRNPQVTVQIAEMQSRGVSVVGAVARPGVFQVREARPLLELLALAGGLAPTAGDRVIVVRAAATGVDGRADGTATDVGTAAPTAVTVGVRALLESGSAEANVLVHPGDQVKVVPAGLAYVVGEVRRPGAFPLGRGAALTVLRAIAMAEGLAPNAARGRAMVIRTDRSGARVQLPVDVGGVLAGRTPDVVLQPEDVVFVPSSRTRAVTLGVVDALVRTVTLRGVF